MDNHENQIGLDNVSGEAAAMAAKPGYKSEIYDWLQCVVSALLFCILFFVFVARIIGVVGTSMMPTLENGDRVFISNAFYEPRNGDIVVFRKEAFRREPLVKRVIAVGGQEVDIDFENGIVTVDGKILQEDYIADLTRTRLNFAGPLTVPEGQLFVMGDNRNDSLDSRYTSIGLVDERYIMGKVYFVVMPFSNMKKVG